MNVLSLLAFLVLISNSVTAKAIKERNDMLDAAEATNGKKLVISCVACHVMKHKHSNKKSSSTRTFVGPNLFGIVGRKMASQRDFSYSAAILKRKTEIWTVDNLSKYLKSPTSFMPGTMMSFNGILDPQDRMDVIAYLMTLK